MRHLHWHLCTSLWQYQPYHLDDLKVTLRLTPQDVVHIKQDLHTASLSVEPSHVYPPYVQMLIEHMWQRAQVASTSYSSQDYQEAGGMAGIIGSYLERQLAYAQDRAGHLRRLLVALVRSYGSKAQRSLVEIVADTGLTTAQCEGGLEQLIHLRLVRHLYVPDDAYEVAHDFLAYRILTELTDADEREFKRFRELLLPLQCRGNRPLYIRLSAYALIGAARQSDQSLLCRLAHHPYRLIARAAAVRLVYFDGEAGLRALASTAVEAIKRGEAQQLAGALFDAEMAQRDLASLW